MRRTLKIAVLKDRYPTRFMTPRRSRHKFVRRRFAPLRFINSSLDGLAVMQPGLPADFVHIHNRIPIGVSKFVINFESHLPRTFGMGANNAVSDYMYRKLADRKCRRIIAMSHYAARNFELQNGHREDWQALKSKLIVRHPNIVVNDTPDPLADDDCEELVLTFVGGHFARKGGCVTLRLAEKALARGLPVKVNIISALTVGGAIWTDPIVDGFFDPYFELLSLPNVAHYGPMPNRDVRAMLGRSHFGMLPTFADSFGYSAIEGMAEHTPAIATRICALREFVEDGFNGYTFGVETNENGEWQHPGWENRNNEIFANYFRDEVERLSDEILSKLEEVIGRPEILRPMRANARQTAELMFDTRRLSPQWDDLYNVVADESIASPIDLSGKYDFDAPASCREAFA